MLGLLKDGQLIRKPASSGFDFAACPTQAMGLDTMFCLPAFAQIPRLGRSFAGKSKDVDVLEKCLLLFPHSTDHPALSDVPFSALPGCHIATMFISQ